MIQSSTKKWFGPGIRHGIKSCFGVLAGATVLLTFAFAADAEPTLSFDPPPGTRLSNFDAYLTISFDLEGESWGSLPWDWQNPRVRLNGQDISLPAKSLLAGATATVLTPAEIVVSQQTMTDDRMTLELSGLRLDPGFNRIVIEIPPRQEGLEPLTYNVAYPVIAGQGQSTAR